MQNPPVARTTKRHKLILGLVILIGVIFVALILIINQTGKSYKPDYMKREELPLERLNAVPEPDSIVPPASNELPDPAIPVTQ